MLFFSLLACPAPEDRVEVGMEEVRLEVGTSPESIGPDASLVFSAVVVSRRETPGETQVTELSDGPFLPVVLDPSGEQVTLVPAPDPTFSEAYNSLPVPDDGRMTAEGGFAPGVHTVSSATGLDGSEYDLDTELSFVVQPTTRDRELLAPGDTFLVKDYRLHDVQGVLQGAGSSWLRVAEVDGDRSRMELIIESDYRCVAVNAWTDWSGDGSAWSQDSLTLQQEDITLTGYGVFANLPVSQDGAQILSGQAHMVVDMSAVDLLLGSNDAEWDPGESCALLSGLGLRCGDCLVGEPGRECLSVSLLDLNATRLSDEEAAALDTDLPPCGVDLADIEAPVIDLSFLEDLNFDCGCTTAAGFSSLSMGWLALALVRTRRRKKQSSERQPERRPEGRGPAAG